MFNNQLSVDMLSQVVCLQRPWQHLRCSCKPLTSLVLDEGALAVAQSGNLVLIVCEQELFRRELHQPQKSPPVQSGRSEGRQLPPPEFMYVCKIPGPSLDPGSTLYWSIEVPA